MTVIMKDRFYVRVQSGKPTLTSDICMATKYNGNAAENYINSQIAKKLRPDYKVVAVDTMNTLPAKDHRDIAGDLDSFASKLQNDYNNILEQLYISLKRCDDEILDIRHYIRDENTKLNACEGFKIFKELQSVERERVAIKMEIFKIDGAIKGLKDIAVKTKNFHFEPYKPRTDINIAECIT